MTIDPAFVEAEFARQNNEPSAREHLREARAARFADVAAAIRETVLDGELSAFDRRRRVLEIVRKALTAHGHFCRTADNRSFYFARFDRQLYDIEQQAFAHLLAWMSGLSPTENEFRFVHAMLAAEAARGDVVEVHNLAFFDPASGLLAISDGGPGVWVRERGGDWRRQLNGERGLLFFAEPDAAPWEPDFDAAPGALDWFLQQIPFADDGALSAEDQRAAFLICVLGLFFPCFSRTVMIPAFVGPQGSGKTTAMRLTGRLLVGPQFDVMQLRRDKEDAFVAAVTNRLVCGLDNVDARIAWLEDSLATLATRQRYQLRRLYSTNDLVSYAPRAFVMVSSRDPRFRRPDVAQRLLIFRFRMLNTFRDEPAIFADLEKHRPAIWAAMLAMLAMTADKILDFEPPPMKFRMADFTAFGWRIFRASGNQDAWTALLARLESAQNEFAAEGDAVIDVLRTLLERDGQIGPIETGELFRLCRPLAEDIGALTFPRTATGFGRKLTGMARIIEGELGAKFTEQRGHQGRRTIGITRRG
jgi:hypothetical protein